MSQFRPENEKTQDVIVPRKHKPPLLYKENNGASLLTLTRFAARWKRNFSLLRRLLYHIKCPLSIAFFTFCQKSFRVFKIAKKKAQPPSSSSRPNIISLIPRKKKRNKLCRKNIKLRCGSALYSGLSLYTHFCDL